MIVYDFTLTAVCPVDSTTVDVYEATLRTDTMIEVEELIRIARKHEHLGIYQEELTATIHAAIGHGELTTVGTHSGIKVTVVAGEYPCST